MSQHERGMFNIQPATRWEDATPTGCGSVGAMVFGHIRSELVLLNHEMHWQRQKHATLPDVSRHLPEIRRLIREGRYDQADTLARQCFLDADYDCGKVIDNYLPMFDLGLEMSVDAICDDYRRSLNFHTGEVQVGWHMHGQAYRRRLFVSRARQMMVLHVDAPRPVNCRVQLHAHTGYWYRNWADGSPSAPMQGVPLEYQGGPIDGEYFQIVGRHGDGLTFGGVARVIALDADPPRSDEHYIHLPRSRELLVFIKLFVNTPADRTDAAIATLRSELGGIDADYDTLLGEHEKLHRPLFEAARISIAPHEVEQDNERMVLDASQGRVSTAMLERMHDYGRFLLIAASGKWPANLQGVWNGSYQPNWNSDYHNDENIQMNYWSALPGNLAATTLPYFDYYESFIPAYRENARKVFNAGGILVPIAQSITGMIYCGKWVAWQTWISGAGWLAQLFYDYYLFTGDETFLRERAVPFMKEVAAFYDDYLIEDANGKLEFIPSLSPENSPNVEHTSMVVSNATMDVAVAKEIYTHLIEACELLEMDHEARAHWRAMLGKLPTYEINHDGAMREWLSPGLDDNYHHRHQSHMYPLFPGWEITRETHPDLFDACKVAVEKRLVIGLTSQTGWSLAHMANIYARLGEAARALECLELLARSTTGPNLLTYHNDWRAQAVTMFWGHGVNPPYQIDALLGLTAAVLEMLLYSKPGLVKLLPACPEQWKQGSATGLRARGGIEIDLDWNLQERRVEAKLTSRQTQNITVNLPGEIASVSGADVTVHDLGHAYRTLRLQAGQAVTVTFTLA